MPNFSQDALIAASPGARDVADAFRIRGCVITCLVFKEFTLREIRRGFQARNNCIDLAYNQVQKVHGIPT
jgi:hypothetical protein